ncbi:MAG: YabP/YqfC family sporulation protein [Ruminococcus sp.]|nr:YabP/YqfC family sporulation protein [Ruminococcus sp.]
MFNRIKEKGLDTFYLNPQIYFDCNRELLIENCKRIEEYNEIFMRLVSGTLYIQIWGNDLRAYDFKSKGLVVRGKISRVEFIERGGSKNEKQHIRSGKN